MLAPSIFFILFGGVLFWRMVYDWRQHQKGNVFIRFIISTAFFGVGAGLLIMLLLSGNNRLWGGAPALCGIYRNC
jgi:hypothetical protein